MADDIVAKVLAGQKKYLASRMDVTGMVNAMGTRRHGEEVSGVVPIGTLVLTVDGCPVFNPHMYSDADLEGKVVALLIKTADGWSQVE